MRAPGDGSAVRRLLGQDVLAGLTVPMARQAMAGALSDLASGALVAPLRQTVASPAGTTLLMPAWSRRTVAVKVLHLRPGNPDRGLPTISGELVVSEQETGRLLALIDAPVLTALRTAGLAGLASRLMAPEDTTLGALIGAGFQAPFQARAMAEACPGLRRLRLFNRTRERALALADALRADLPQIELEVAASVEAAVKGAQLVTTVTSAPKPLIRQRMLASDCHINAMGAYTAHMAELGPDVLAHADQVYVDTMAGCAAEAGDLIQAAAAGAWSWSKAAVLPDTPRSQPGLTVFKSVGSAAFDLAAAEALLGVG